VLGVFLARPHHLHRIVHLLGHAHRCYHHVRLELAAEAAAEQVVVDDHLLDRQSRRLGASDCTRLTICVPVQISQASGLT
jgi:hypothetical protein